jgi:hypothetical protein
VADALERRMSAIVGVNCYVTFGSTSAFNPHYDTQDVVAIQVHGVKRWRGYGTPMAYPVTGFDPGTDITVGNPTWEERIESGDVLYVPRGEAHDAVAEVTPSVHLTLSIVASNGIDLINWMARQAHSNPVFRMDVTRVDGEESLRSHGRLLKHHLHNLVDQLSFDKFLNELNQQRDLRVRLNLGLDNVLNCDTWLVPTSRRRVELAPDAEGEVDVVVGGNTVRLSTKARQTLHLLLQEDGLPLGLLAQRLAPAIQESELLEAIAQLVAGGLVAIEASPTG